MSELSDLLERFRRGPELLTMATTGAAGSMLDFKPEDGLSMRQIVCHVSDAEALGAVQLRHVLVEDNPPLLQVNLDNFARRLDYSGHKISYALEAFRRLRADNYELLEDLAESAFAQTGMTPVGKPVTLSEIVEEMVLHLEKCVRDLQSARAAYKEHRAQQAG